MESESDLIQRARQGDSEAFGQLVLRCRERVYMVALQMVHNHSDADELSQQAFLRAFQSLNHFRGEAGFFTWMYRITINLCLTFLKGRQRFVPLPEPASEDPGASFEFSSTERVEQGLEQSEVHQQVWDALAKLGPEIKAAAVLVYIQDLSPREAGRILGCAEATVHWRLFKARKILKKFLDDSPSPLAGEGVDGGDHKTRPPTSILPHKGGGG